MNFDIVAVGRIGFDIFINGKSLKTSTINKEDALNLENNHTYEADHSIYEVGGSAMNSALTFARQGIKTGLISRMGNDYLSNQIREVAKKEGISTDFLLNIAEHHTDLDTHIVTERASEIVISYQNSTNSLRSKDIKFNNFSTRLIYISELPADYKLFKHLVEWGKINGAEVWANVSDLRNYKRRQVNYVLSNLDGLMMPMEFVAKVFNDVSDHKEILRQIVAFGSKNVLLYDVYDEAYASVDKVVYQIGRYKNINPLDKTGANDAFAAGYVSSIFQGKTIPDSLTLASANASSVLEVFGARPGILRKPALRTMNVNSGEL